MMVSTVWMAGSDQRRVRAAGSGGGPAGGGPSAARSVAGFEGSGPRAMHVGMTTTVKQCVLRLRCGSCCQNTAVTRSHARRRLSAVLCRPAALRIPPQPTLQLSSIGFVSRSWGQRGVFELAGVVADGKSKAREGQGHTRAGGVESRGWVTARQPPRPFPAARS